MYVMHIVSGRVSVLIPSRNEIFLSKTIQDILQKAKGDIEIIAVLDGYWPTEIKREFWTTPPIIEDPRVRYLQRSESQGMRSGINSAAAIATGEFLIKSDAHCMYAEGFDEQLKKDIPYYKNDDNDDNWIVIPRRQRLDAEKWEIQELGKPPIDYEYLSSPADKGVKGNKWDERTRARMDILIDENMSFQGSCWFMTRNHYLNRLGSMSEEGYGSFVREAQEIGLKTWLSGGRIYTNKNTWYAHLHKGPTYGRMYFIDKRAMQRGNEYCDDFWFNNRWDKAKYDLAWLIKRFEPVPTWTPELIQQVEKR
jgi:glycosyltransferase involved in cell wall biosynthesis